MAKIDLEFLRPFLGNDPVRPYLHVPFNQDGFTWATNGAVLIRVAEMEEFSPIARDKPFNVSKPLAGIDEAKFVAARWVLPPFDSSLSAQCKVCDGRGVLHDCPECDCLCEPCAGTGEVDPERRISVQVLGRPFTLCNIRKIATLPGLEISDNGGGEKPLLYKFDGGAGGIMPITQPFETHVDIEVP